MDDIIVVGSSNTPTESDSAFEKLAQRVGGSTALEDIYEKMTWIEYLFDISGSMNLRIERYSDIERYEWTEEILNEAKIQMAMLLTNDPDVVTEYDVNNPDDVKQAVADQVVNVDLPPERNDADAQSKLSKIQIARKCAKTFLEKRYEKYPDARVGVVTFGSSNREVVAGQDKATTFHVLDMELQDADGGGTNMHAALTATLSKVRKARGSAHHFILVTDGEPTDKQYFEDLTRSFKDRKAVLDVIFLRDKRGMEYPPDSVKSLKKLAEATGGTVEYVDNESDFEQKFLAVSNRKMLGVGGVK